MEDIIKIISEFGPYIMIGLMTLVLFLIILVIVLFRSLNKLESKYRNDLSFSLAMLDENNDGILLTGIFGRNESTTYAKPIEKGISRYDLSEEEEEALNNAINK